MESHANNLYINHKELVKRTFLLPDTDTYYEFNSARNVKVSQNYEDGEVISRDLSLPESLVRIISAALVISNFETTNNFTTSANFDYILTNGNFNISKGLLNSCDFYFHVYIYL